MTPEAKAILQRIRHQLPDLWEAILHYDHPASLLWSESHDHLSGNLSPGQREDDPIAQPRILPE